MSADERDRSFDKALAHHLRSAAPASQSSVCPDPETLAAYHERSLLPEQLNSLKEHIVGCANCQTILAHLETTDEIPLQAAEEEQVFAHTVSAPVVAGSSQIPTPSQAVSPSKSRRARLLRGARWQWLVPAGAIAAGLLVWIALHENYTSPLPSRSESESKMAQNKVPPSPAASDSIAMSRSSASEKSVNLTPPPSPASEPAIANGHTISRAMKQSPPSSDAAGASPVDSLTDKKVLARKDRERDASEQQLTATDRAGLDTKNLPEELKKKEDAPAQAAKVQAEIAQLQNSQTQNQTNNYVSPKVPGPGPLSQAEAPRRAKATAAAAPAAPPPGQAGVVSRHDDSNSLKFAQALFSNPRLISPPGSNVTWRVGRGGLIEFSKDGGSSWSRQSSGILADLLTGSAPSDQVCWIVGRAGSILLTTDEGAHWKLVKSPLAEDLAGIRATDALHATIWNARNTRSFETSDGGLTWTPVPSP